MTESKQLILNFLNEFLAISALVGFIVIIGLYAYYFYTKSNKNKKEVKLFSKLANSALLLGFLVTLFAAFMSMVYSDYLGQAPCGLCWFQRIFIYSQVILFIVAYLKNDFKIFTYTFWLSIIGGIIALYHEYLQVSKNELIPCPTTPGLVDCADPTFLKFGFVTFPFMSLLVFLSVILLSLIVKNYKK